MDFCVVFILNAIPPYTTGLEMLFDPSACTSIQLNSQVYDIPPSENRGSRMTIYQHPVTHLKVVFTNQNSERAG